MVTVSVQYVVFHTDPGALGRAVVSVANSYFSHRHDVRLKIVIGDCSPAPVLPDDAVDALRLRVAPSAELSYHFFGANLGHGGGQNILAEQTAADFTVFSNPDVVVDASALSHLLDSFDDRTVGIVEAKQLPQEHPKDFDAMTGMTSWASGAFSMVRRGIFDDLGGFDHRSFFMHGDDVDLSWRIRHRGFQAAYQPAATVFHDKRWTPEGGLAPSSGEARYSAQAALMLAYKWSRDDVLASLINVMRTSESIYHRRALEDFGRARREGSLPERWDAENRTAEFVDGNYAAHRW
jgi:GT2 family glycosyltransferase